MSLPDDSGALREVVVHVKPHRPDRGVVSWWDEDAVIRIECDDKPESIAIISGNAAGPMSLARHLLTLTQPDTPRGSHMDFDTYFGWFEEGSAALRVELD